MQVCSAELEGIFLKDGHGGKCSRNKIGDAVVLVIFKLKALVGRQQKLSDIHGHGFFSRGALDDLSAEITFNGLFAGSAMVYQQGVRQLGL